MIKRELLLGDEALALGAINAGLSGVYAYPGTPSTEITEFIQGNALAAEREIHCTWSANEKTAMEEALGMSFAGKRALVCMKHVGMNVAADAFVNSAMTGANGGLVVVAADDPSMHSSQNEQDSRFYGRFAFIPTFEPSSQQEAYDMIGVAFEFSEKYHIPVLMRLTTRMAHSRAVVEVRDVKAQNTGSYPENARQWVLMPGNSRARYKVLLDDYRRFEEEAAASGFNRYIDGKNKSMGIITCGIAFNYLMENYPDGSPYPVLKIAQYPLPTDLVRRLAAECDSLLVIEEGQPLVEESLRGILPLAKPIRGRMSGELPRTGELTPDTVRAALGLPAHEEHAPSEMVVPRPPALCVGCGHRDVYTALNDVLKEFTHPKVFSDIGCYTLGWLAPFHAIDSCVDMGASITMAKGAADAGQYPSVAVIGDSTFTHSGMTGLLDAVNEKSNITIIISDNLTTGMTGGQDSAGTGRIEQICTGIGVDPAHIRVIVPLPKNREALHTMIREEIAYNGVSVIIPRRECIQTAKRHNAKKE
ncbi:MAG: thiamine pyrophosphate-dependent enzyme [Alistipes sp.]